VAGRTSGGGRVKRDDCGALRRRRERASVSQRLRRSGGLR
jgi:hypothetical protein